MPQQKQQDNQPRQAEADGPLIQHRHSGRSKGQVIPVVIFFAVAAVEGYEGQGHRKEQGHIRDHRMADIPGFQGSGKDEGRHKGNMRGVEPPPPPVKQAHGGQHGQGRCQPGGEVRKAEQIKGRRQLPIEKNRLIKPEIAQDAGGEIIIVQQHFPGRLRIIALHWVGYGQKIIAQEIQQQPYPSQHPKMLFFIYHR